MIKLGLISLNLIMRLSAKIIACAKSPDGTYRLQSTHFSLRSDKLTPLNAQLLPILLIIGQKI